MSGIVGMVGPACGLEDWVWVQRAAAYMTFCGPDGWHAWHDGHAALAHASLRTTDDTVDRVQPFQIGSVWITGDVRLDGRGDLTRRLRSEFDGITTTTDDAELVVRAYELWGQTCLEHLSGDFAFAIWDPRRRQLFCARDQFGVAPFYYARTGKSLLFSNALDSLLLNRAVSDDLNDTAVGDSVLCGMNMDRTTTTFAAIQRLAPGHTLTWCGGPISIRRYWHPSAWRGFIHYPKADDYVEQFRELFNTAVSDRLRTNRVTVELSGGLDSTSVAVTAHRLLATAGKPFDLRAQTIVLDRLMTDDDGHYARLVTAAAGISSDCLVAADYPNLDPIRSPDVMTPEPVPYLWTDLEIDRARRAARHGRVALSGQGGDAALMYLPSYWMTWLARGEWRRLLGATWEHLRLFHRPPRMYFKASLRHLRSTWHTTADVPEWLDDGFVRRVDLRERSRRLRSESSAQIDTGAMGDAPFWSNIFSWADPGFTRVPVKYRHPFFDRRLQQFLLALPPAPWFARKMLLREAVSGVVPEEVSARRKTALARGVSQALAQQRGLSPAALAFLTEVPGLDRYLARDRFARELRNLATDEQSRHRPLVTCLGIAHWMAHRRRPQMSTDAARGFEHGSLQLTAQVL